MTYQQWQQLHSEGFRPAPGRCVIELEQPPTKVGLIHVPGSAQVHGVKATGYLGRVLDVNESGKLEVIGDGLGRTAPDFKKGDRVAVGIHADELAEQVIWAWNGQVHAVVTGVTGVTT